MDPPFSSISIDPPPQPIIPVVANPTTTVAGLPSSFNHPPYPDMICEAIEALKEKNGSSKRAIAKFIESAYKDLPPTHPALLTHNLKRLKNNGLLVMVKKSYKLASTARSEGSIPDSTADASPGSKRGRGRPPKPLPTAEPNSQLQSVSVTDGPKTSGRPRKNGPVGQLGAIKGQGRPPKSGPKKSPGRPRKPKTVRSVAGANAMKRGRGRPPKALNQLPPQALMSIQGQPMAVPYADVTAAAATATVADLPRPRGRPKAAAGAAGVVIPGKRRGRPPKMITAKPIRPKKTTVKPGRPKKTTHGAESKALAAAYGDLKRKLEFFQSKVKQAVGVLKPQFTGESNISAIGAIQELEGLAAMDISTPVKEDAQPPLLPLPAPTQPPVS
ncbi:histone H1-II-like [Durio zibethinus]|uniref:Histone H1-II-like n=1 Tax=Durio zibethinus TaxID=66656 RepID=A0A6P5XBT7_DURZI|nr:histone H1-II-like [Durio zibethinus]